MIASALALLIAVSSPADGAAPHTVALAESRLRACLATGATQRPYADLRAAVLGTRAFCGRQINRLRQARVQQAAAGLPPQQARAAERRVTRELDAEIALAVANFTGLQN